MLTIVQSVILVFGFFRLLADEILRCRNITHITSLSRSVPEQIEGVMNTQEWSECSSYTLEKIKLSRVEDLFSYSMLSLVLVFALPWYYAGWTEGETASPWICSFFASVFLFLLQIPDLFFDWFRQFGVEQKYGFNQSTKKLWITDKIKGFCIGFPFLFVLIGFLDWLFRVLSSSFPNFWWMLAFSAFFLVQLLIFILWPKLILPLFNKLTPLSEGELKDRLMQLATKTGFHAKSIEVIDGSRRSTHSNAYFTGFGKFRRIVLFDTLVEQMSIDELEAVVAHEIGHYRLGHIPKRLFISFLMGLGSFLFLDFLSKSEWFYYGLNLPFESMGSLALLIVILSLYSGAFTFWLSPISNIISRKNEFEADKFAAISTGKSTFLSSALRKLYKKNKNFPLPHRWIAFFHHSHPSLLERERALAELKL